MRGRSQCILLGGSLVIFISGVYFDSKAALLIGSIYGVLAIPDIEMTGSD